VTSALALASLDAVAQARAPIRRIGVLSLGDMPTPSELEPTRVALRDLGWIEDKNFTYERRYVGDRPELLKKSAQELVGRKVDLLVTSGTDAALAAKQATSIIPIVMFSVGDPVLVGLVSNLSHPGGNITGFSIVSTELDAKRLELLRELIPGIQRVGELVNSSNPYYSAARPAYERIYDSLGLEPIFLAVRATSDLEDAVATAARQKAQALVVPGDNLFNSNRDDIMRTALRYRLPTIVENKELLESGGLIAYTFNSKERAQRYAAFVDKILRGATPGDLPIEQPTTFELLVNLRTARELGLVVPRSILTRANEVVQ
jgi:putative ABC transport system substrate-binding protein